MNTVKNSKSGKPQRPAAPASSGKGVSRRTLANRRNALKSTGPKTAAGKRRVALNGRSHPVPPEVLRELRARGEDPRNYGRLCCDLAATFPPEELSDWAALDLMARTWWEKARRLRNGIAPEPPPCDDLDRRIEGLLLFLVDNQRERHQHWRVRLAEVLGWPLGSPADVRRRLEARLHVFGAMRHRRRYPVSRRQIRNLELFKREFAEAPAGGSAGTAPGAPARARTGEGDQSQAKPIESSPSGRTTYMETSPGKANRLKSFISNKLQRIWGRFSAGSKG